jgi:hypothetical protein
MAPKTIGLSDAAGFAQQGRVSPVNVGSARLEEVESVEKKKSKMPGGNRFAKSMNETRSENTVV